jgi:hypothetical protein
MCNPFLLRSSVPQDPPFGIHLCGDPDACVVSPPVVPVHEERVRPYRPLPTFRANTIVQHYLKAEEMRPYHEQASSGGAGGACVVQLPCERWD